MIISIGGDFGINGKKPGPAKKLFCLDFLDTNDKDRRL